MATITAFPTSNFILGTWTNPDNVYANDNAYAVASSAAVAYALKVAGYDFSSIPAGSTINSVTTEVGWNATVAASSSVMGTLQPYSGFTPTGTYIAGDFRRTWTSSGNFVDTATWSVTLSELQADGWGVLLSMSLMAGTWQLDVDYISVTVDYGGASAPKNPLFGRMF